MTAAVKKKRVLFVCIGNSCRSQMAEGFARTYGEDCMIAASAGVARRRTRSRRTRAGGVRLVVNISGSFLPPMSGKAKVVDWDVPDPVVMDYEDYCAVRDEIERRVVGLIKELRRDGRPWYRAWRKSMASSVTRYTRRCSRVTRRDPRPANTYLSGSGFAGPSKGSRTTPFDEIQHSDCRPSFCFGPKDAEPAGTRVEKPQPAYALASPRISRIVRPWRFQTHLVRRTGRFRTMVLNEPTDSV